jgi:hypothetical protein
MTQSNLLALGLAGLATVALVARTFRPSIERTMNATVATIQTISLGSAARAVILNPLSRWAAMAAHSDEVFRLSP